MIFACLNDSKLKLNLLFHTSLFRTDLKKAICTHRDETHFQRCASHCSCSRKDCANDRLRYKCGFMKYSSTLTKAALTCDGQFFVEKRYHTLNRKDSVILMATESAASLRNHTIDTEREQFRLDQPTVFHTTTSKYQVGKYSTPFQFNISLDWDYLNNNPCCLLIRHGEIIRSQNW